MCVFETLERDQIKTFILISKWGLDGSSGNNEFKQRFDNDGTQTDASVVLISVVPIRLEAKYEDKTVIVWQNPRPSSTQYCRPIKFMFVSESTELIVSETAKVKHQIKF